MFWENFVVIRLIKAAVIAFVLLTTLAYLQWIARKATANVQLRVGLALVSIAVSPFVPQITVCPVTTWMELTDLRIGILFVLAVSSIGVYGVALGGWASNNKYSLLGGLRSSAQMISYELPLALAVAAPLLLANTLSFREMVNYQSGYWLGFIPRWNVIPEIVGFIIFMIASFA